MENIAVPNAIYMAGRMIRNSDTPADLRLASSCFSDMSPYTITEDINMVMGTAIGIIVTP